MTQEKRKQEYPEHFPRRLLAFEPPLPAMELLGMIADRCERGRPLSNEQRAYLVAAIRAVAKGFNKWNAKREKCIEHDETIPAVDKYIPFASALFFKRQTRGAPSRHLSPGNLAICERIEALRDAGSTRANAITAAAREFHLGFEATEGIYSRTAKALGLPKRAPIRRKPKTSTK